MAKKYRPTWTNAIMDLSASACTEDLMETWRTFKRTSGCIYVYRDKKHEIGKETGENI